MTKPKAKNLIQANKPGPTKPPVLGSDPGPAPSPKPDPDKLTNVVENGTDPMLEKAAEDAQSPAGGEASKGDESPEAGEASKGDESPEGGEASKGDEAPEVSEAEKQNEKRKKRAREVFATHDIPEVYFTSDDNAFTVHTFARMHSTSLPKGEEEEVITVKRSEVQ